MTTVIQQLCAVLDFVLTKRWSPLVIGGLMRMWVELRLRTGEVLTRDSLWAEVRPRLVTVGMMALVVWFGARAWRRLRPSTEALRIANETGQSPFTVPGFSGTAWALFMWITTSVYQALTAVENVTGEMISFSNVVSTSELYAFHLMISLISTLWLWLWGGVLFGGAMKSVSSQVK